MKTILILSGVLFFFALASTLESYDSENRFNHCIDSRLDSVITDMDVQILTQYCEIHTGYRGDSETI